MCSCSSRSKRLRDQRIQRDKENNAAAIIESTQVTMLVLKRAYVGSTSDGKYFRVGKDTIKVINKYITNVYSDSSYPVVDGQMESPELLGYEIKYVPEHIHDKPSVDL
ncbi:MAG: hypothetical protein ACXAAH_01600 [Promethearchaeota archaeon]